MLIIFNVSAQDSLKVMQYNLLNFGNFTDYCSININNPTSKTAWLKTIVDYYLPDVFSVNEISQDKFSGPKRRLQHYNFYLPEKLILSGLSKIAP